jgi:nucleotide-binding universal stress UspA family protein
LWATPAQIDRHREGLRNELETLVRDVFGPAAVGVRCHVLHGQPGSRIVEAGEDFGADLVVVGSTGKGAVARALMGSVSCRVAQTSRVPVLTVH